MKPFPCYMITILFLYDLFVIEFLLAWINKLDKMQNGNGNKPKMNINHCFILGFSVPLLFLILTILNNYT